MWDEPKLKEIRNMYTVTALAWKKNGSRVTAVSSSFLYYTLTIYERF